MHTTSWAGIIVLIFLFLTLTVFLASKIQVTLPYSTDTTSVLKIIWDNISDWISPF